MVAVCDDFCLRKTRFRTSFEVRVRIRDKVFYLAPLGKLPKVADNIALKAIWQNIQIVRCSGSVTREYYRYAYSWFIVRDNSGSSRRI
jgi:hypothetical protein